MPNLGRGFSWTPSVRGGTILMLGAGDNRGLGAGGSVTYSVAAGTFPSTSCLNDDSPSSTPGSPAGGSYPTSTNVADSSGGYVFVSISAFLNPPPHNALLFPAPATQVPSSEASSVVSSF